MGGVLRSDPDVLVVGAGVIGLAIAYELGARGLDVVVAESHDEVGAQASYGNAAIIAPSHCIPLARPGLLRDLPPWLISGGPVYVKPRPSTDLLRFGLELVKACRQE